MIASPPQGVRVGVLEGDVQGSYDADRLASLHVGVYGCEDVRTTGYLMPNWSRYDLYRVGS